MPKKPSEPKRATKMVRLSAELWERTKSFGALKGRTPRQEFELRLSHSFAGGGEVRGLSWGSAMGRLVGMLADESFAYSRSVDEALAKVQVAMQELCSSLSEPVREALGPQAGTPLTDEQQAWARSQGTLFAGKIRWADATRGKDSGTSGEDQLSEKEFRMLQEALLLSPRCLEAMSPARPTKRGPRS